MFVNKHILHVRPTPLYTSTTRSIKCRKECSWNNPKLSEGIYIWCTLRKSCPISHMRVLNGLFGVSLESFVTLRKIYMRNDAILCHQYRQDNQHVESNIIKTYCSIMLKGMYDDTIYTPEMVAFLVSSIWITVNTENVTNVVKHCCLLLENVVIFVSQYPS